MAAKFCTSCGKSVPEQARFCPHCRAPLTGKTESSPSEDVRSPTAPTGDEAKKPWRPRGCLGALLVGFVLMLVLAFIGSFLNSSKSGGSSAEQRREQADKMFAEIEERAGERLASGQSSRTSGTARNSSRLAGNLSALQQMELAFVGNYTQTQIKTRLERAMRLYGVEVTEENRSRAGSALVTARKDSGYSEMEILNYMICSHVPGVRMQFGGAAGLAGAMLKSGDRCR